jgi:hypothetical protein
MLVLDWGRITGGDLFLLQIFFDAFGLSEQKRRIFARGFNRPRDELEVVLKLFSEFVVFLIPPTTVESMQLAGERIHAIFEFVTELGELMSKPP